MKYKLGEVCDITSSKRIFASEYRSFGVPFYQGKEIIEKQAGKPVSNELFIEERRYNEIKSKHGVPQKGDLLLTSVGTLGIPYIIKNERFYFKDGNLTWFRNFRGVTSEYIYYWLLSTEGQQQIDSKCIGSTQKALTIETLLNFELDLPSLTEQIEIGRTLSALDAKIAANTAINHNLEQMTQVVYTQVFPCYDNPTTPLGGIIDVRDGTHDSPKAVEQGFPLVTSKHLLPYGVDLIAPNCISKADFDKINERSKVDRHDILISMIGTIGLRNCEIIR